MSTAAITSISTMERSAATCIRCRDKGHTCYASHIQDGVALCIYCMDDEPCFYEQRNKSSKPSPVPRIIPKKESPMVATAVISTPKANGHAPATLRICKCGCGETVPAENRFAYIQGHLKRAKSPVSTEKCHCGRPLGHTGKHVGGKAAPAKPATVVSVAPPVSARVSLEVTEAQLNQFLVKLSLEDKQRLANYFLQSAE